MYVLCRYVHMYTNLQILDIKVRFEAAFCRIRQFSAVLAVSCHLQQFSSGFSSLQPVLANLQLVSAVFCQFQRFLPVSAVYSQFQQFTASFRSLLLVFSSLKLVTAVYSWFQRSSASCVSNIFYNLFNTSSTSAQHSSGDLKLNIIKYRNYIQSEKFIKKYSFISVKCKAPHTNRK